MTKEEYFGDWGKVVDLETADTILQKLKKSRNPVCPLLKNLYKAFRDCPFRNLRCVIIGQDPYNNLREGKPVATGIAFANSNDTSEKDYSPSLDILKDSVIDFTVHHSNVIFDPSLESWEKQGVLLLNAALSCEAGKAGSHALLWRPFIRNFLTKLSNNYPGIVYVLMGTSAQGLETSINTTNNHVIKIRHPSYYARTKTPMPNGLWYEINNILIGQNGQGIEWYKEY